MADPSSDPSIEHEPHLQRRDGAAPPPGPSGGNGDDPAPPPAIEHSAWDEPALGWRAAPPEAETYAVWLRSRCRQTSGLRSWMVMGLAAYGAGPWALLGTFLSPHGGVFFLPYLVLFGPAVEEVMKGALVFYLVERKPYLVRSASQIILTILLAAFCFAAVENLLYLNVYIPDPSPGLAVWRWTVCVALHMGCSAIFGIGLVRVWKACLAEEKPPELERAVPYWIAAVALHGTYNGLAVLLELGRHHF